MISHVEAVYHHYLFIANVFSDYFGWTNFLITMQIVGLLNIEINKCFDQGNWDLYN